MNFLYPSFRRSQVRPMLIVTLLGGMVGGLYGVAHDLVTYSISHEYFTQLKFHQLAWANIGFPSRLFAAEIGFIAAGAVGSIAGWVLGRIAIPAWPVPMCLSRVARGFSLVFLMALLGGAAGYWLGLRHSADYAHWDDLCFVLDVTNIPAFVRVAYIHNGGYLGGFFGLVVAAIQLSRLRRLDSTR